MSNPVDYTGQDGAEVPSPDLGNVGGGTMPYAAAYGGGADNTSAQAAGAHMNATMENQGRPKDAEVLRSLILYEWSRLLEKEKTRQGISPMQTAGNRLYSTADSARSANSSSPSLCSERSVSPSSLNDGSSDCGSSAMQCGTPPRPQMFPMDDTDVNRPMRRHGALASSVPLPGPTSNLTMFGRDQAAGIPPGTGLAAWQTPHAPPVYKVRVPFGSGGGSGSSSVSGGRPLGKAASMPLTLPTSAPQDSQPRLFGDFLSAKQLTPVSRSGSLTRSDNSTFSSVAAANMSSQNAVTPQQIVMESAAMATDSNSSLTMDMPAYQLGPAGEYGFSMMPFSDEELLNQTVSKGVPWTYASKTNTLYLKRMQQCVFTFALQKKIPEVRGTQLYLSARMEFAETDWREDMATMWPYPERCPLHLDLLKKDRKFGGVNERHNVISRNEACRYISHQDYVELRFPFEANVPNPAPGTLLNFTESLMFSCYNSCNTVKRRNTKVVFTLLRVPDRNPDTLQATVFGRIELQVRVCACPGRDRPSLKDSKLKNKDDSDRPPSKRRRSKTTSMELAETDENGLYVINRKVRSMRSYRLITNFIDMVDKEDDLEMADASSPEHRSDGASQHGDEDADGSGVGGDDVEISLLPLEGSTAK